MRNHVTIVATSLSILALVGCVATTEEGPLPSPTVDPGPGPSPDPMVAAPGPVAAGPIGVIDGFDLVPVASGVTSPVTAITPDGATHFAYLEGEYAWPFVGSMAGGEPVALPGAQMTTTAVTMIASADGTLHLAWDADRQIRYVRRYADGTFSEPVLVGEVPSREPNLAMTSIGEVVLAWTHDTPDAGEERRAPQIFVAVGAGEPVDFDAPRAINEGCCVDDVGGLADRMSGPSLAIGLDDAIHVVYEWSSFANTTIEYVKEEGEAFSAPVQISDAAFVPCPALMVDADGAHITYLREFEPSVYYRNVVDGVADDEIELYTPEEGRVTMSMAVRDAAGVLHLGVTEEGSDGRLHYLRVPDVDALANKTPIIDEGFEGRVELTPRAGGMLVAPHGEVVFSFLRMPYSDEATTAELAIGR